MKLEAGIDYTLNKHGELVFTKEFLLKRGHCCKSGCLNCPYNFSTHTNPDLPSELQPTCSETEIPQDDELAEFYLRQFPLENSLD